MLPEVEQQVSAEGEAAFVISHLTPPVAEIHCFHRLQQDCWSEGVEGWPKTILEVGKLGVHGAGRYELAWRKPETFLCREKWREDSWNAEEKHRNTSESDAVQSKDSVTGSQPEQHNAEHTPECWMRATASSANHITPGLATTCSKNPTPGFFEVKNHRPSRFPKRVIYGIIDRRSVLNRLTLQHS